jgi:hypothetical protein
MQRTLFEIEPRFTNRTSKAVTFLGKLDLPIHRWYRLTPSFSPKLAGDIADCFALTDTDFVLDPFSGVGTVPLCMKYRGIRACSVEINPFLHFVGTVKTRSYHDLAAIESTFDSFISGFRRALENVPYGTAPNRYLSKHASDIPRISRPERWWSPGNLAQLVCLRQVMANFAVEPCRRDLLKLAILGILIPVSNAKHNHVSLTFADRPLPTVEVADVLERQLRKMLADLIAVRELTASEVTIHRGNSKAIEHILPDSPVSAVITSPPYPNRFSYARETRPHLFFFDFISDAEAVGQLETDAIGGTWGKATSVLSAGVAPKNDFVADLLRPFLQKLPASGQLMAHYVTKYFNDMFEHAAGIAKVCKPRCRLAYVIGNSKFYENPIPSDELVAKIFAEFGFSLDRIERMRKRQSKSGLYEAVVFMNRRP